MGILDWRILDLVDAVYDRGLNRPKPDPEAWKKWYPMPEAIGLVDPSQFPAKPQLPVNPLFPKIEGTFGFDFKPINENPTIRDCIMSARWSDLFLYGGLSLIGPVHYIMYTKYTRLGMLQGVLSTLVLGPSMFLSATASTINILIIYSSATLGTTRPECMVNE